MLINLEGIDGSGKTSVLKIIKAKVHEKNWDKYFLFTREPGGLNIQAAEDIRKILLDPEGKIDAMSEALLYTASRQLHLHNLIKPNFDKKIIITDRYYDSFYAYQGFGRQLGYQWVKTLTELIIQDYQPQLSFFFEAPLKVVLERTQARKNLNRLDTASKAFFERVALGYERVLEEFQKRYVILDATKKPEIIAQELFQKMQEHPEFQKIIKEA